MDVFIYSFMYGIFAVLCTAGVGAFFYVIYLKREQKKKIAANLSLDNKNKRRIFTDGLRVITVNDLIAFTADMPMKQIDIDGTPYLQRYYAGTTNDGHDMWFHRFLNQDADRHLHNHPFEFKTVCLHGGYAEEIKTLFGIKLNFLQKRTVAIGHLNFESLRLKIILEGTARGIGSWHRIAKIKPDTWTVLLVNRDNRVPFWFFEEDGECKTMKGSGPEWFLGCKTRAEQAGDGVVQGGPELPPFDGNRISAAMMIALSNRKKRGYC
jgi:hypothetical protein